MLIPANRRIAAIPHLRRFLADRPRAVVGWGRKPSGRRAECWARWLGRPFVLLEDGFVRGVGRDDPPLALILDHLGTYYDATAPSALEQAIAAGIGDMEAARARALAGLWREGGVSKYNHAPDYIGTLPEDFVLVVDQTFGDLSVRLGLADERRFAAMLAAALAENPASEIVVKVHPDVFARARRGWLALAAPLPSRVTVIGSDCHPARLLDAARAVYTVTSLMGFEALLRGKPVRCFGMPFYAGWGLTLDDLPAPGRRGEARFEALVHGALVTQSRYVDPASGEPWQAEQAIAHVAAARRAMARVA
jgi:capsular polysaccharide export protein